MKSLSIRHFIAFFISFFLFTVTSAQSVPSNILDTINIDNRKVVIYADKTWEFLNNTQESLKLQADTCKFFKNSWNSEIIYSYLGEKKNDTLVREIKLTDSLHSFVLPVYGKIYGIFSRRHAGIDIELKKGDPVKAAFDGRIRFSTRNGSGYGNLVIIRHYNGLETYYGHLSKRLVKVGQEVKAGDVIGLGGSTGHSYANHLHFETRYHDKPLDPLSYIDFDNQKLKPENVVVINKKVEPIKEITAMSFSDSTNVDSKKNQPLASGYKNTKGSKYYYIKKGDTLFAIAKKNGTSVKKICALNHYTEKSLLVVGKKILVN
jgi:murein DD-endopeptidase MepM/ murein hydrolase activator NlpD